MASQCLFKMLVKVGLVFIYLAVTKSEGLSASLSAYGSPSSILRLSLNFTFLAIFRAERGKALSFNLRIKLSL